LGEANELLVHAPADESGIFMSERTKTILLVDDSETFLMYTSKLLRRMGYENIASVKNGTDALKLLNILMPDIILLDIAMPQMDGIATLRLQLSDISKAMKAYQTYLSL
jgi:CheY-like chemotaxis protein